MDGWTDGHRQTDRQTNYEKNNLSHPDGGWTKLYLSNDIHDFALTKSYSKMLKFLPHVFCLQCMPNFCLSPITTSNVNP